MKFEWKGAVREVLLAAVVGTVFYLFAAALFAVIVKAACPAQSVVNGVGWALKALTALVCSLLFIRAPRALIKGMVGGFLTAMLIMLLFAAIGGGFFLTPFFLLELLLSMIFGALGSLIGAKFRKESV